MCKTRDRWTRFAVFFLVAFEIVALTKTAANAQCQYEWAPGTGLPGLDGTVNAAVVFNDGSGDALYVGGSFSVAGDMIVSRIAKWNGSSWSALGSGMNKEVLALTVFDDGGGPALYAGGSFTTAGGVSANSIAKWNGLSWSALGSGMNGSVYTLTVFDDGGGPALYAGGEFTTAGGVSANRIAKWDSSSWSALGSGMNNEVLALTVFNDGSAPALYAGGRFTTAGGVSANRIAKWNGSSWSALGPGMDCFDCETGVLALTVFDDGGGPALYAGGGFTTAGSVNANRIAKWNGSSWSALGPGMNHFVSALTVFDDGGGPALYAGGRFITSGGVSANRVAKWDGLSWSALGSGIDSGAFRRVNALTVFDDGGGPTLYSGGNFTTAGGVSADNIAKWNGSSWSALGSGMSGGNIETAVYALTVFDDGGGPALYAGGTFSTASGVSANNAAKWNGSSWSALGSGTGGSLPYVFALTVFDDGGGPALYAGGTFSTAGGMSANGIAKWNGSSWSVLGSGIGGSFPDVYALTVFDDGGGPALYAGGLFTTAGGVSANYIAKWDGSSWSALGSGMDYFVLILTVFDDGGGPALYAGGGFTTAGGVSANRVAKWDGLSWSALSSGMNNEVRALTVFDDGGGPALFIGGGFTAAGQVITNRIAKWDGTGWSPLGSGMDESVYALTVFDDGGGPALYAAGSFTTAGGLSANRIAKWDGASWRALGSGMNRSVSALTAFDDGGGPALYAGGRFSTAGGRVSAYFAKWSFECLYGDVDADDDVDLFDFAQLQICFGDAAAVTDTGTPCTAFDFDADAAIDAADYRAWQSALTGP